MSPIGFQGEVNNVATRAANMPIYEWRRPEGTLIVQMGDVGDDTRSTRVYVVWGSPDERHSAFVPADELVHIWPRRDA